MMTALVRSYWYGSHRHSSPGCDQMTTPFVIEITTVCQRTVWMEAESEAAAIAAVAACTVEEIAAATKEHTLVSIDVDSIAEQTDFVG